MVRKLVSATLSAALCIASVTPALAQDYRYTTFDAPRGAAATANLRVPLGREAKSKPTYGLSFGFGQTLGGPGLDGRTISREARIADLRFGMDGKLQKAKVASFDLANLDEDRRMNLMGGGTLITVVGLAALGVGVCLLADCFDGDDDNDDDDDDNEN